MTKITRYSWQSYYRIIEEDAYDLICKMLDENIEYAYSNLPVLPVSKDPRFTNVIIQFRENFEVLYRRHDELKASFSNWHHHTHNSKPVTVSERTVSDYIEKITTLVKK
jgi:hypothetical protein